MGGNYCYWRVCMFVCLFARVFEKPMFKLQKSFVHVLWSWLGSV